jgi:hypothetical protein
MNKSKSEFPPTGAAIFLLLTGAVLLISGYFIWRNGDGSFYAIGYWKGRMTMAMPLGLGMSLVGTGVLFGNFVKVEHFMTKLLMIIGGLTIILAFASVFWMPAWLRPGAGSTK